MARETRRQRRDQRKSSGAPKPAAAAPRAARSQPQVRPGMQPSSTQTGRRERQRGRFVRESWAELKKVEWPSRAQVVQGTIVVIIACVIVGTYLYAADQVFKPFVRTVLLGE
jgi:preprotein translocase subunit SecE